MGRLDAVFGPPRYQDVAAAKMLETSTAVSGW
jgi:hypothetical protein